jgi:hypothetical protein
VVAARLGFHLLGRMEGTTRGEQSGPALILSRSTFGGQGGSDCRVHTAGCGCDDYLFSYYNLLCQYAANVP